MPIEFKKTTEASRWLDPRLSPLRQQGELLCASRSYYNANGANYWADFVAEEKRPFFNA